MMQHILTPIAIGIILTATPGIVGYHGHIHRLKESEYFCSNHASALELMELLGERMEHHTREDDAY